MHANDVCAVCYAQGDGGGGAEGSFCGGCVVQEFADEAFSGCAYQDREAERFEVSEFAEDFEVVL